MSANDLQREIQGDKLRSKLPADKLADVEWLDVFIEQWNAVSDREDAGEQEDDER